MKDIRRPGGGVGARRRAELGQASLAPRVGVDLHYLHAVGAGRRRRGSGGGVRTPSFLSGAHDRSMNQTEPDQTGDVQDDVMVVGCLEEVLAAGCVQASLDADDAWRCSVRITADCNEQEKEK